MFPKARKEEDSSEDTKFSEDANLPVHKTEKKKVTQTFP